MEPRIKILFLLNEFVFGSKVRTLIDLVSKLDRDQYDIHIAGHTLEDPAIGEVRALGLPIEQLRLIPPRALNLSKFRVLLASLRHIRKQRYDVVHTLTYQSIFFDALFVKLLTNAAFIYSKTNLQWENHRLNWRLKSHLSDAIISISSATDELLAKYGFANKTHKIPIGVNQEQFQHDPQRRAALREQFGIGAQDIVYGCAAQFIHWKGHHDVLAAFELLVQRRGNIKLLYCGSHYNDEYYLSLVRKVATAPLLSERVIFAGVLRDMQAFYSAIDCMVLPSTEETFGYVYIEAMSCNRPVIGCNLFGPKDIIDNGVNGYLVAPSNPAELAERMASYLQQPGLLETHGKNAREKVSRCFSSEVMAARHDQLYRRLLQRKKLGR